MNHYDQFPMMLPYVGKHFRRPGFPALLLVGESHYLPVGASQHLSAETWYASSSGTLSDDEVEWISTADILEASRVEGFSNKAHSIWKNALWEINEHGPGYSDYKQVTDDIAFYNFFLRPAVEGDSLEVAAQDVELANEAFQTHYDTLKPSAVVFLSSLAYNHLELPAMCSVPVIPTPHPGCPWWNRAADKYGNRRGRDILADFVRSLDWPRSTTTT